MATGLIGGHTGGYPQKTYMFLVCGTEGSETITKGNVVEWATDTQAGTANAGAACVQSDGDQPPIGIACNSAAAGEIVRVQTGGPSEVATAVASGESTAQHLLLGGAAGELVSVAAGSATAAQQGYVLGLCLAASTSSVQAAGDILLFPRGAY